MASIGFLSLVADRPSELSTLAKVRRQAIRLESGGQSLFAWLHSARCANHGVVMCPPLGYEQVHSHRSWRVLADALAVVGFPVLRFDYHGTGDSAGCDEDPNRLATWLANVLDASKFLRNDLDCEKVSLVGLRMGATLATLASALEEIDSLLLWNPVVSCRQYVREMKALSLTAPIKAPPLADAPGDVEAAGFILTKQTVDELSELDLLKAKPRCRRALILARDDGPEDRRMFDHLTSQGITVSQTRSPDTRTSWRKSALHEGAPRGDVRTPSTGCAAIGGCRDEKSPTDHNRLSRS